MSTAKVVMTRDGLSVAIQAIGRAKINTARERLASLEDDTEYTENLKEWRSVQQARVIDLYQKIEDGYVTDGDLEGFAIKPLPERPTKYNRERAQQELNAAQRKHERHTLRFHALTWPEDNTMTFTDSQLSTMFGV